MKRSVLAMLSIAGLSSAAVSQVYITEFMYQGIGGANTEFIEFTNFGSDPVDFTGWSYDDDNRRPGQFDLSGFGLVAFGESVVITEMDPEDFRTRWGLSASVKILGPFTNNLGRNDEINLYDNNGDLVDRLAYGDQFFPGSIRPRFNSANIPFGALGQNDPFALVESAPGDVFGSFVNSAGEAGNPGFYYIIPAPGALALLGMGGLIGLRRRR